MNTNCDFIYIKIENTHNAGEKNQDELTEILKILQLNVLAVNKVKLQSLLKEWQPVTNNSEYSDIAENNNNELLQWEVILQLIARSGILQISTAKISPIVIAIPYSYNFVLNFPPIDDGQPFKVSRFAYLRKDESGDFVIQSPKSYIKIILRHEDAISVFYKLSLGASIESLQLSFAQKINQNELKAFVMILINGLIIEPCYDDGTIPEDRNTTLKQWDFHDLVFHSQSRLGRNYAPVGGNYRFKNELTPQPAIKAQIDSKFSISLPKFDLNMISHTDPTLTTVIETRRSIRDHTNPIPISFEELSQFLFRVARVSNFYNTEAGEFTHRPYPNGGASYELELYLTIDRCLGLDRGFYYYHPGQHALHAISAPTEDMEMLLHEAWLSSAMTCHPQVLISIASRFQRVSWKYQGIAYAAQLKNLGVLYSTMYLVATAMKLAPCGLGLGNSDRFTKLSKTNYYEEGSIGEFMLGSRNPGT